ncbi:DUF4062 domain-containing protein [Dyadobacter psychrophilus]|uniref:DUF4062 domain-containing protein n=1 Tax=Dyadobacter psychrophilus TaxID=651661 RepID=A0A1T5GVV3_9BACT|nr:DUF4062 domain-containing protein [Dyadobacter psychrophilus]SKC12553.1 protein of unknown function [Dyadobacter psychrophilus]
MSQVKIFVSSTCLDLVQIRSSLQQFIVDAGHQSILSEYFNFPIDPSDDTIENCIRNVGLADILILIVGSRYGYVTKTGKSITEQEYLSARTRGIPIYIFVSKILIDNLPKWKLDKGADFMAIVESTKVFEFIEELREKNGDWCFPYESVEEITATLKYQLSFLFKSALDLRLKYRENALPYFHNKISVQAINIILLRNKYYEVKFFLQVLKDELRKYEHVKLDLEFLVLPACERVIKSKAELVSWLEIGLETSTNQGDALNTLLNEAAMKFYGEPGNPSDLSGLYYAARGIARIYKMMIDWSLYIRSTLVPHEFLLVRNLLSEFLIPALDDIWAYPDKSMANVENAIAIVTSDPSQSRNVDLVLKLTIDSQKVGLFTSELEKIKKT